MFVREVRAGTEAETVVRAHVSRPSQPQREKENEMCGAHRSAQKEEQGRESSRGRRGFCVASMRALQTSEENLASGSARRRIHTVEGRGKRREDAVT